MYSQVRQLTKNNITHTVRDAINDDKTDKNVLYYGEKKICNETNIPLQPKILIVEDSIFIQTYMKIFLKMLHCEPVIASSGSQFKKLFNPSFSLVFLDIGLPDTNGLELATIIREQEKKTGTHMPIIVTTCQDKDDIFEKCVELRIDEINSKLNTIEDYKRILKRWLNIDTQATQPILG